MAGSLGGLMAGSPANPMANPGMKPGLSGSPANTMGSGMDQVMTNSAPAPTNGMASATTATPSTQMGGMATAPATLPPSSTPVQSTGVAPIAPEQMQGAATPPPANAGAPTQAQATGPTAAQMAANPSWAQFSPAFQADLAKQDAAKRAASELAGPTTNNEQTNRFNTSLVDTSNQVNQQAIDANYGLQKQMLDPQWQQQQADTETQLANMGLSRGSAAWDREAGNIARNKAMAYNTAQLSAVGAGNAQASRHIADQLAANAGQNAGLTAQQNAAQGWENFRTQRANAKTSAEGQIGAANASASGMVGAANVGANASMSNAKLQNDYLTRVQNSQEQQMNFNNARTQLYDPLQLQNLAMQGMYPGGAPTFAGGPNTTAAGPPNSSQADYAAQINAGNNQSAGGIAGAISSGVRGVGSLGGLKLP